MSPSARLFTIMMLCLLTAKPGAGEDSTAPPEMPPPCPSSPNCVSSGSTDEQHLVDPLRYRGDTDAARAKLTAILENLPRVRIVAARPDYLHAEFRSLVFRFVDDVEFWLPAGENVIHVRSASRIGYSDFGANRKRVERIRALFEAAEAGKAATAPTTQ